MEENTKNNLNDAFVLMSLVSNLTETYETWIKCSGFLEAINYENNTISKILKITHPEYSDKTIHCISLSYLLYVHMNVFNNINTSQNNNDIDHIIKVPLD